MNLIPLTQGKVAIVDDADFEWLSQFRWHYHHGGYAERNVPINGEYRMITMHREIMRTPLGMDTDHINGNKLDNRRENLRICTRHENTWNQPIRSNNTSGYKGVSFERYYQKWAAYICVEYKQLRLGHYDTPEEAAREYDKAARIHYGEYARLNNPG